METLVPSCPCREMFCVPAQERLCCCPWVGLLGVPRAAISESPPQTSQRCGQGTQQGAGWARWSRGCHLGFAEPVGHAKGSLLPRELQILPWLSSPPQPFPPSLPIPLQSSAPAPWQGFAWRETTTSPLPPSTQSLPSPNVVIFCCAPQHRTPEPSGLAEMTWPQE